MLNDHVDVEILEPDPLSSATTTTTEVRALVKIEEIRLERTKIRAVAMVISVALLSWAAICHATCGIS